MIIIRLYAYIYQNDNITRNNRYFAGNENHVI